jgi:UDP-N-acetylmuramoyl-L-alanyl-D-glutamate--2,6-diaminopimelate ligase
MKLSELVSKSGIQPIAFAGDAELSSMTLDSRKVERGSLFVCMPDMSRESQDFLSDAAARGASAAIVHDRKGAATALECGLAALHIPADAKGFSEEIWRICDAFFDHPTRNMKVVGITGTNGKTTTASITRDVLSALGLKAAYLGTLGVQYGDVARELANTTPLAVELYNILAELRAAGVQALAMEVSSHALEQRRADGVEFDVGVFTNLTQDHLDYHGSMSAYRDAKWRLFSDLPGETQKRFTAVINTMDPVGRLWADRVQTALVTYGTDGATMTAKNAVVEVDRISFDLNVAGEVFPVAARLGGTYNLENILSAIASVYALGYPLTDVIAAIREAKPVPGRFEAVPNSRGIGIIVDYAHSPDALTKLLDAVRPLTKGRIITVFGCGGDRDKTKRPIMARSASKRSDLTVVTSDNPRMEDPEKILKQVIQGIEPGRDSVAIIDRGQAVAYAIGAASSGDVVVIAGKGHENYQIIGREKIPMDDRELARLALEAVR